MLVSDLLRYRNDVRSTIDQINLTPPISEVSQALFELVSTHPHDIGHSIINSTKAEYDELLTKTINLKEQLPEVLVKIDNAIDELASTIHNDNSLVFFQQYHCYDFQTNDQVLDAVIASIHQYSNFYYPALQFGCTVHSKNLTNELVASDPLYLCDFDEMAITDVAGQFNEVYYSRLRKYTINKATHDIGQLPHNQFGFILSWMLFNYTNMACIQNYLTKMLTLLRPGGVFLFSYNNCDLLEGCELAERGGMSYVTKRQLLTACQSLGYELVADYNMPNEDQYVKWISWLVIKRPGELSTAKRHPVLGEIKQK